MTFPTSEIALDWLKDKLLDFYAQSGVLKDKLILTGQLMTKAKAAKNQTALGQLTAQQAQWKKLLTDQLALEQKIGPIAQYLGVSTGLGLAPAVIAVIAIPIAALVYTHFQKIQNQSKSLDLIAKGLLTPEEAKAIAAQPLIGGGLLAGLGGMGVLAIAAIGAFLFLSPRRS